MSGSRQGAEKKPLKGMQLIGVPGDPLLLWAVWLKKPFINGATPTLIVPPLHQLTSKPE